MLGRKTKSLFQLLKKGELTKQLKWKYYVNTNHKPKNTLFISGMGRSGTTWLSQLLNHNNQYRYIFEPFYPKRIDLCDFFEIRQYLNPLKDYPKFYNSSKKIVTGDFRNHFLDRYNKKFFCGKRLIKDVKTNLMLGWLNQNFEEMKIILTKRHPCAVASSWLKLKWKPQKEVYLNQNKLIEDYLEEFKNDIQKSGTNFEKYVYMWCIEYYVPLKQQKEGSLRMKVISYENLCENFNETMVDIYDYIGEKFDPKIIKTKDTPSYTTRPFAAIMKRTSLLDSWKENLSNKQIKKAEDIVTQFGLEKDYEF